MIHRDEVDDVVLLRLEHGKVNALDVEVLHDLGAHLASLREEEPRPVVLAAAGRVFSAGVDLRRVLDGGPPYAVELIAALSGAFVALFSHPTPVVAAVNGAAIAGGCILACAADQRLIVPGAKIGATELTVGVPFPASALEVLRHAAGPATEAAVLTGRLFDAEGALLAGLVHEVVTPETLLEAAVATASSMATAPPPVYARTKAQLRRPALETIATGAVDDAAVAEVWGSPQTAAAITASLERTTGRG